MKTTKLNYLTEEEAKMPIGLALLQLAIGLQSCSTKGNAVELLGDAVELGRRLERKALLRLSKQDKSFLTTMRKIIKSQKGVQK